MSQNDFTVLLVSTILAFPKVVPRGCTGNIPVTEILSLRSPLNKDKCKEMCDSSQNQEKSTPCYSSHYSSMWLRSWVWSLAAIWKLHDNSKYSPRNLGDFIVILPICSSNIFNFTFIIVNTGHSIHGFESPSTIVSASCSPEFSLISSNLPW